MYPFSDLLVNVSSYPKSDTSRNCSQLCHQLQPHWHKNYRVCFVTVHPSLRVTNIASKVATLALGPYGNEGWNTKPYASVLLWEMSTAIIHHLYLIFSHSGNVLVVSHQYTLPLCMYTLCNYDLETRGRAFGWGIELQAGGSRVRLPT